VGLFLGEGGFKFKWRTVAKGGMQPFAVVNVGDEVIDASADIGDGLEGPCVQFFGLDVFRSIRLL
jgi:hypothetical protein